MRDPIDAIENNPKTGHQERHPFEVQRSPELSEELLESVEYAASPEAARRTREEMERIALRLKEKRN